MDLSRMMQDIENMFNLNPEPILDVNLAYQFDITGEEEGTCQLFLQSGQAKFLAKTKNPVDCTLTLSFESFKKFLTGNLSGTVAFMTGKLKIDGNITTAMKLETILKEYNRN